MSHKSNYIHELRRMHHQVNTARVRLDEALQALMYEIEAILARLDEEG